MCGDGEVGSVIWNNKQMRMPGVRAASLPCYLRAFDFANPAAKEEQKQTAVAVRFGKVLMNFVASSSSR